jgi:hypothetical protein
MGQMVVVGRGYDFRTALGAHLKSKPGQNR